MNKQEAIKALDNGERLTHTYFTTEEWVEKVGSVYIFEDGVDQWPVEFWAMRTSMGWDNGWGVVE